MHTHSSLRGFLLGVVLLSWVLGNAGNTDASVVKRMTDAEMTREAGFVLHATVTDKRSVWNPEQTQIYTYVDLLIHRQLKGQALGDTFQLRLLGGLVDDIAMTVIGSPTLSVNEEVVLFLGPNPQTFFPVVGLNQGELGVEIDLWTGRKVIPERDIELEAFLGQVEEWIQNPALEFHGDDDQAEPFFPGPPGFRLEGALTFKTAPAAFILQPSQKPPFIHWDLREFPDCTIPYSFFDGTADIAGLAEFDAVDAGFGRWQMVMPSVIQFNRVLPAAGAMCPLLRDNHNMIGWNGLNCKVPGDDVCIPAGGCACHAAIAPGADIIRAGPDGWLLDLPNNCCDDCYVVVVGVLMLLDGGNGVRETAPQGDDVAMGPAGCYAAVPAAAAIIGPGPNGVFDTVLNNCCDDQAYFNAAAMEWRIRDGGDGFITTSLSNGALPATTYALTGLFYNNSSGAFFESDILFNDNDWTWQNVGHNVAMAGMPDVRTIATHEIGHFFGLHHTTPNGLANGPANPIMNPFISAVGNSNHNLQPGDMHGVNFLYTPDLGDAPDPLLGIFNRYPSAVHSGSPGRTLNGVELVMPAVGAEHLFGFVGPNPAVPLYQYEWLAVRGGTIDDHPNECEYRPVDNFDDGVTFGGVFVQGGPPVVVTIHVQTSMDNLGNVHPYAAATPMYINGWFDWNADGDWDDASEHEIGAGANAEAIVASGAYPFAVAAPLDAKPGGWARFRLDYEEDVNQASGVDKIFDLSRGAAQFGEVEDYPIRLFEIDFFPDSEGELVIDTPMGSETLVLRGPTTVEVDLSGLADTNQNGLEEMSTEIVQLELTGNSIFFGPIIARLRPDTSAPFQRTIGIIEEKVNNTPGVLDLPPFAAEGVALSFFDVFFEIEAAGMLLHNKEPKRLETQITHKPPAEGERYEAPQVIELFDENDNLTPILVGPLFHTPRPLPVQFIRGDTDGDGQKEIGDALGILRSGFVPGFPILPCLAVTDVDGDRQLNPLLDALFMLNCLFLPGSPCPPPPWPECGTDKNALEAFGCEVPPPACNP